MGHSMGGGTVAAAAGQRPDLFRAAILEDPAWRDEWPAGSRPESPKWEQLSVEQVIAFGKKQSPDWNDGEFPAWAESKRQLRVPADWASRRPSFLGNWRERATAIGVPTLLTRGSNACAWRRLATTCAGSRSRSSWRRFPHSSPVTERPAFGWRERPQGAGRR
jgi:pimeloyl-ACP methyl ester carboxylesterase